MNDTVRNLLIFAAGAVVGSVAAVLCVKRKYADIAQREIDSVKEVYKRRAESSEPDEEPDCEPEELEDDEPQGSQPGKLETKHDPYRTDYNNLVSGLGYIDSERPYVIPPHEFAEIHDYGVQTLYLTKDGKLVDKDWEIIDDIDDIVGYESLDHMGEYEDDTLHVRNDRLKCDYEIYLSEKTYEEGRRNE